MSIYIYIYIYICRHAVLMACQQVRDYSTRVSVREAEAEAEAEEVNSGLESCGAARLLTGAIAHSTVQLGTHSDPMHQSERQRGTRAHRHPRAAYDTRAAAAAVSALSWRVSSDSESD